MNFSNHHNKTGRLRLPTKRTIDVGMPKMTLICRYIGIFLTRVCVFVKKKHYICELKTTELLFNHL